MPEKAYRRARLRHTNVCLSTKQAWKVAWQQGKAQEPTLLVIPKHGECLAAACSSAAGRQGMARYVARQSADAACWTGSWLRDEAA